MLTAGVVTGDTAEPGVEPGTESEGTAVELVTAEPGTEPGTESEGTTIELETEVCSDGTLVIAEVLETTGAVVVEPGVQSKPTL